MKKLLYIFQLQAVVSLLLITGLNAQDLSDGKQIFDTRCKSCHKIGGGNFVGPDLKDVHSRRNEEWLIKFIQSPAALINGGDEEAVALFEQFNKIMMPDHKDLNDERVSNLVAYIKQESTPVAEVKAEAAPTSENAAASPIERPASTIEIIMYVLFGIAMVLILIIMYMLSITYKLVKNPGSR